MKQIIQSLGSGEITVEEVPIPRVGDGTVLVETACTAVSPGTERMLIDFARAGWLDKARQQPDKVREVFDKIRTDGLLSTMDSVRSKLDEPLALGYCNVGVIREVGAGVTGFRVGDRVVSNGPHSEFVVVPTTLCARVPDVVSDDAAAFTVIASIALQGIRLLRPTLGERVVVTGLGLVGLMSVQMLLANGCRVLGIDPDPVKVKLAEQMGADVVRLHEGEDPVSAALAVSDGHGMDGVLLTLASTDDEPISQAARMCRKRGRIVLVGVTGLRLNRADFYEKELTFQVSASYGPGRYDPNYESRGQDYPIGFVRWTAQRNFEAVLDMMARDLLSVEPLITHRFPVDDAPQAYELLASGREPYIGILLEYSRSRSSQEKTIVMAPPPSHAASVNVTISPKRLQGNIGVIGAGNYAGRVLIPALHRTGASLVAIANTGGVTGMHYGKKYGFQRVTTDIEELLHDPAIDTVVIATRHDSHAKLVVEALRVGKNIFVEKPLALTQHDLENIQKTRLSMAEVSKILMVGFNRRFAPLVQRMKGELSKVDGPKTFIVTVNAGDIPKEHWTQDPSAGGGRLIGEACHFIDLLRYLTGEAIASWHVKTISGRGVQVRDDKASITLAFADGSIGTIHYFANGHKGFPKERVEVFTAGRVLQLDNFRVLRGYGWPGFRTMRSWRQDKGQDACVNAFVEAVRSGSPSPIPFDELMEVSRVTIEIGEAARS